MAWMPWHIKCNTCSVATLFVIAFCYPAQAAESNAERQASLEKIALEKEASQKRALKLSTVDRSQKIRVDRFELLGFKEFSELNWTRQKVEAFLQEQMIQNNHQFTISELDNVARKLSVQMKQAGLMFSRADLLEQEIKNNTVELTFEEGLLGEVVVMDARRTQPALLVRPFLPHLQSTAIRDTLDQALYTLDQLPGVDIFGFFSFTETPGLSRLNLRVVDESTWTGMVHTDNYGNESVGRERVHATLDILNLTGWGDTLKLNVGRSYHQPGFFEGYVQYTVPMGAQYQPLKFLISNSEFNLGQGFESLEVFGQSTLASVNYRHNTQLAGGALTYSAGASYTLSKVDSLFYTTAFFRDADIKVLNVGARYASLLSSRLSQNIDLGLRLGKAEEASDVDGIGRVNVETNFSAIDARYRLEYFHKNTTKSHTSVANVHLFGSPDVLPSVEQRGFGGRNGIKGLPTGYFSADNGIIFNMTHDVLLWPSRWPGQFQLTFDAGIGKRAEVSNDFIQTPSQTAQFASLGVGYAWQKYGFRLTYGFGKIIHANLDNDFLDQSAIESFNGNKPSRHYLSFSYDLGEHK